MSISLLCLLSGPSSLSISEPFAIYHAEHRIPMETTQKACRLLYLVGQLGSGGLERQLCYLLQAMNRESMKPGVVVWNYRRDDVYAGAIQSLGIPIYSFSENTPRHHKLNRTRRLVRMLNPDVVHSYSFYTNFAAWWCSFGSKTIALGSIRNNFLSERRASGTLLGSLSARLPATQICNSHVAQCIVEQSLPPFKPTRLHVVRNRLDIRNFRVHPSRPSKPSVLAVGRLYPEKRWDRLIKVVALVRNRGLTFSVRHAGDGPLRKDLEAQARQLDLDSVLTFLGPCHDIAGLLADSTLLIHTADAEGCPNVVMEAMACGRAVLATDAGDVSFLVEDGKTGFVVNRGDDEALADRLATLIINPDLCREMGRKGRDKAEREFGLHRLLSETLDVYRAAGWRD